MSAWIKDKVFNNGDEFVKWLDDNYGDYITAHISQQHTHHTWKPNHSNYPKYSTLQLHQNMRRSHMDGNGWDDIAQHITIGKDGLIVLGRDICKVPVSAKTHNGTTNWHPFAYEMIGNFDVGNDKLEGKQLESAIKISRYFHNKGKAVMFHRELLLYGKVPKTCPGTGVDKGWFMGLVKGNEFQVSPTPIACEPSPSPSEPSPVEKQPVVPPYIPVTNGVIGKIKVKVDNLNIRVAPDTNAAITRKANKGEVFDLYVNVNDWHNVGGANWIFGNNGEYLSLVTEVPYPNVLIKEGSEGEFVKMVQRVVGVKDDGIFGAMTKSAVKTWQAQHGLSADGIVGKNTWNALFN